MKKILLLQISGMSCINCRYKIEKILSSTPGIFSADVNFGESSARITYDSQIISEEDIISVIEHLDYKVLQSRRSQFHALFRHVILLVLIIALFAALAATDILNVLVPGQLADSGMSYGMIFIIGLLTSVHCIAMCGGINLSQCIPGAVHYDSFHTNDNTTSRAYFLRPAVFYNLGRVISYTVLGFVLGASGMLIGGGTGFGISPFSQGLLKIIAGSVMIIVGINMLGLFPALRNFSIALPGLHHLGTLLTNSEYNRPFFVGLLNGFMPCGPLQAMWIIALASGNPVCGALSMFLFSLGTVPLMLGFGSAVSLLGKKFTHGVLTIGAILVVVLGLAMLSQGASMSGLLSPEWLMFIIVILSCAGILLILPFESEALKCTMKFAAVVLVAGSLLFWSLDGSALIPGSGAPVNKSEIEMENGVQVVCSTLESGSYPDITVQTGTPVKWVINAPEGSINGCNNKILIPDLDLEYSFQPGENTIEFTADESGTIQYSCWMGMIHGSIFVTEKGAAH